MEEEKRVNENEQAIVSKEKLPNGYKIIINSKIINISDFLSIISKKVLIDDVEIENENVDSIIVKLYEEFGI